MGGTLNPPPTPPTLPTTKPSPPPISTIQEDGYKALEKTAQTETPYIILKNATCEVSEQSIVGVNVAGMLAILNGAVHPDTSWVVFLFQENEAKPVRKQISAPTGGQAGGFLQIGGQVVKYADRFPLQCNILATCQDILLKARLGMSENYEALKTVIVQHADKDAVKFDVGVVEKITQFMNIGRGTPPSFNSNIIDQYVYVMKNMVKKTGLDVGSLLAALEAEMASPKVAWGREEDDQDVRDAYDYSKVSLTDKGDAAARDKLKADLKKVPDTKGTEETVRGAMQAVLTDYVKALLQTPAYDSVLRGAMEAVVRDIVTSVLANRASVDQRNAILRERMERIVAEVAAGTATAATATAVPFQEILGRIVENVAEQLARAQENQGRQLLENVLNAVLADVVAEMVMPDPTRAALEAVIRQVVQQITQGMANEANREAAVRGAVEAIVGALVRELAPLGLHEEEGLPMREVMEAIVGDAVAQMVQQAAQDTQEIQRRAAEAVAAETARRLATMTEREVFDRIVAAVAERITDEHLAEVAEERDDGVQDALQDTMGAVVTAVAARGAEEAQREMNANQIIQGAISATVSEAVRRLVGPERIAAAVAPAMVQGMENMAPVFESVVKEVARRLSDVQGRGVVIGQGPRIENVLRQTKMQNPGTIFTILLGKINETLLEKLYNSLKNINDKEHKKRVIRENNIFVNELIKHFNDDISIIMGKTADELLYDVFINASTTGDISDLTKLNKIIFVIQTIYILIPSKLPFIIDGKFRNITIEQVKNKLSEIRNKINKRIKPQTQGTTLENVGVDVRDKQQAQPQGQPHPAAGTGLRLTR